MDGKAERTMGVRDPEISVCCLDRGRNLSYGDYDFWVISLRGHTYGQRGLYDAKAPDRFTAGTR